MKIFKALNPWAEIRRLKEEIRILNELLDKARKNDKRGKNGRFVKA